MPLRNELFAFSREGEQAVAQPRETQLAKVSAEKQLSLNAFEYNDSLFIRDQNDVSAISPENLLP
jgi:hypothetical protein